LPQEEISKSPLQLQEEVRESSSFW